MSLVRYPRVLFPFVGDTVGGSHHSAAALIQMLPNLGFQPLVLLHRQGSLAEFFTAQGIDFNCADDLPYWESGQRTVSSFLHLVTIIPVIWNYLRRLGVDLIHVNDGRMLVTWSAASRVASIPLIAHQRTRIYPSKITHFAFCQSTAIVSISDYTRSTLPKSLVKRSHLISNPFKHTDQINRVKARAEVVQKFKLDPKRPIIAFVGTLSRQKRPVVAIDTLFFLRQFDVDATLLLIGRPEPSEAACIEKFIDRRRVRDRVCLAGYQRDAEHILCGCDLLLAPAVDEGHGRALVESMLVGTPVVAAESGGHSEIIQHGITGLLVVPDRADLMAAAVSELLANDEKRLQITKWAQDEARRRFQLEAHSSAIVALYRSVLEV